MRLATSAPMNDSMTEHPMTAHPSPSLQKLLSARTIVALQDASTAAWHGQPGGDVQNAASDFLHMVAELHRANFELWHIEDQAREPGASDRQIADTKRAVDRTNQRRNDLAERCDAMLLDELCKHSLPDSGAELHSESPGLMLDRLSILALKIYHTREEIERVNAPEGHAERNRQRLALLETQRDDLAACLDSLWMKVIAGERRFKLYRQLKMYNDPSLNPAMYLKTSTA
jgi:Protein of unknown function (DUF4254)